MDRQSFHRTARLRASDARAPTVELEGTGNVGGHRERRIYPAEFLVLRSLGVFLEIELLHWIVLAVGISAKEPWHGQSDVSGIFGFAKGTPRGILRRLENLSEVARVGQLLPAVHLHEQR